MSVLDALLYGIRTILGPAGAVPERSRLRFSGPGVVVRDNEATKTTEVEIAGGTGGGVGPLDPERAGARVPGECPSSVRLGDVVYLVGVGTNGQRRFAASDCLEPSTLPAIGLVVAKSSSTSCTVQLGGMAPYTGELSELPAGPLFVGRAGALVAGVPDVRGGMVYAQLVGIRGESREILLSPGQVFGLMPRGDSPPPFWGSDSVGG